MQIYLDQTYDYKGQKIKIRNIYKNYDKTIVLADNQHYVLSPEQLEQFKKDLKQEFKQPKHDEVKLIKSIMVENQKPATTEEPDEIKQILFDAINKVKQDPDYIKQANAICNITTQLINIKKLELLNK